MESGSVPVSPHMGVVSGGGASTGSDSMQSETGEDSPNSTPSVSPLPLAPNPRLPYLLGPPGAAPGAGMTPEQLEALYKQLPSSTEQLELVQKQMLALVEQQQKLVSLGLGGGGGGGGQAGGGAGGGVGGVTAAATVAPSTGERIQLPLLWFGVPGGITTSPSPFTFPPPPHPQPTSHAASAPSNTSSNATPSPTASTASSDSGLAGMSPLSAGLSGISLPATGGSQPLSLGATQQQQQQQQQQRRPLSESQSAPGFQSLPDSQFEALQKQFQIQQQQLLLQSQQVNQHYLEQQQRSGCTGLF